MELRSGKRTLSSNLKKDVSILIVLFTSCVVIAFLKTGFTITSLKLPLFFYGDEFFGASLVYTLMKFGRLTNLDFGWPLGQDFSYALVSQDVVPHAIAAILGVTLNNPYLGLNLYFLLSFGLSSAGFYLAARILSINPYFAFLLAMGTTFVPHHFSTATQAVTVISYFHLPLLLSVIAIQIRDRNLQESLPFKRKIWFAISFVSGTIYSYYSIGIILILGTVILAFIVADGNLNALKATFRPLLGVSLGFVFVSIPSILRANQTYGGINYFEDRSWQAVFPNSGTLTQSIAPSYNSLTFKALEFFYPGLNNSFETYRTQLTGYGIFAEGSGAYIGLPLILLTLISFNLFVIFKNHNKIIRKNDIDLDLQKILRLAQIFLLFALSGLFWSWAGGLGQIFAMTISQSLRGYARFYVFCVIALALSVGLLLTYVIRKFPRNLYQVAALFLLCMFAFDGTTLSIFRQPIDQNERNVNQLKMWTNRLPENCKILQFPVIHFPYESPGWPGYALMAPGLLTDRKDLKWSSGAVGGSKSFQYLQKYREFQNTPDDNLTNEAIKDGYCGILIDSQVWDTFHDFAPGENYPRNPKIQLHEFLELLPKMEKYETAFTTYYFLELSRR